MLKQYSAYFLEVKTTDGLGNVFQTKDECYFECSNREIVVLTNDLSLVLQNIGQENISLIKKLGVGYLIEQEELKCK